MENGRGSTNAEVQQQPTQNEFNTRIARLINERPFQSTDQIILNNLSGSAIRPEESRSLSLLGIPRILREKYQDDVAAENIKKHGQTLVATSYYLIQAINNGTINAGVETAKTLSLQLYNYGINLFNEREINPAKTFDEIPEMRKLSHQQIQSTEHLLGIDNFFRPPEKFGDDIEYQRKQILNDFFSDVGRTAVSLLRPISPYSKQITESIEAAITMPVRELENTITRQKTEVLSTEILPSEVPLNFKLKAITRKIATHYNLDISKFSHEPRTVVLRIMLEHIRKDPSITSEEIGDLEKQIAKKIQSKVTSVVSSRKNRIDKLIHRPNPKQYHTSAAKLGATLMKEAGIKNCLIGNTPDTSALFVITTDNKIFMMDMVDIIDRVHPFSLRVKDVTDEMLQGTDTTGIILFNDNPQPEGLRLRVKLEEKFKLSDLISDIRFNKKYKNPFYTLYPPKDGQRILTLFDKAIEHRDKPPKRGQNFYHYPMDRFDNYQKAIKIFEEIISPNLQDEGILSEYGETLLKFLDDRFLNRDNYKKTNIISNQIRTTSLHKAFEAFSRVMELNQNNYQALTHLADIYRMSSLREDREKAVKLRKQAQEIKK
jgi:hypothetical protein